MREHVLVPQLITQLNAVERESSALMMCDDADTRTRLDAALYEVEDLHRRLSGVKHPTLCLEGCSFATWLRIGVAAAGQLAGRAVALCERLRGLPKDAPDYHARVLDARSEEINARLELAARLKLAALRMDGMESLIRLAPDETADPVPADEPPPATTRGPGCRSVRWFGTPYSFAERQGEAVGVLWDAWENGTPDVGQKELLAVIEVDSKRLSDLFAGHPAWGTMIRQGASRGAYRLAAPE